MIVNGLNEASKLIHENALSKGFWCKSKNITEKLMLVVTELAEAVEADRNGKFTSPVDINENVTANDFPKWFQTYIHSTFEDEIADAIIRILDIVGFYEMDIDSHINKKYQYNLTRPYLHEKKY